MPMDTFSGAKVLKWLGLAWTLERGLIFNTGPYGAPFKIKHLKSFSLHAREEQKKYRFATSKVIINVLKKMIMERYILCLLSMMIFCLRWPHLVNSMYHLIELVP